MISSGHGWAVGFTAGCPFLFVTMKTMTRVLRIIILALALGVVSVLFAGSSIPANDTSPAAVRDFQSAGAAGELYELVRVIDGDTIVVDMEGTQETVRLIGIDTPETKHPHTAVECFGGEAAQALRDMLDGEDVRLQADPTQDTRDIYDRLLAYVYLPDGTFVNKKMIEDGFAYEYTYEVPYQFRDEFKAAEDRAREDERGLWKPGVCAQPRGETTAVESSDLPPPDADRQECRYNIYNCADFSTQKQAQATYIHCGGPARDIHHLDGDNDGRACESLE